MIPVTALLSPEGASGVMSMVEVAEELKAELANIDARIEELRERRSRRSEEVGIREGDQGLRSRVQSGCTAFEGTPRRAERQVAGTELFKGRNNRHTVLDVLRRSKRPTTTAEIAEKFASDESIGSEASRLEPSITSRFSATLNGLVKQGLVRRAGIADGEQSRTGRERADAA